MSDVAAPAVSAPTIAAPAAPEVASPAAPEATTEAKVDAKTDKAPAKDATKESPAAEAARKYKVMVDEAEQEVDEAELRRGYQTAKASDKRFREAAEANKASKAKEAEFVSALELIKTNPVEASKRFEKLGIDPVKFAEDILKPIIEAQMEEEAEKTMTPEQLRQKQIEKELAGYKAKEAEAKKAAEIQAAKEKEAAEQAAVDKSANEMAAILKDAIAQTNLPQTYETTMELVQVMREAVDRGIPVDAKTLAKDLESRKVEEMKRIAKPEFIPEEIRKAIMREAAKDPEIREMIRKETVEEYKKNNPMAAAKPVVGGAEKPAAKPKSSNFASISKELMLDAMRRG